MKNTEIDMAEKTANVRRRPGRPRREGDGGFKDVRCPVTEAEWSRISLAAELDGDHSIAKFARRLLVREAERVCREHGLP